MDLVEDVCPLCVAQGGYIVIHLMPHFFDAAESQRTFGHGAINELFGICLLEKCLVATGGNQYQGFLVGQQALLPRCRIAKGYAICQDVIKPAFQDGGATKPPKRINEDQALSP